MKLGAIEMHGSASQVDIIMYVLSHSRLGAGIKGY